jgi:hypothetical protein
MWHVRFVNSQQTATAITQPLASHRFCPKLFKQFGLLLHLIPHDDLAVAVVVDFDLLPFCLPPLFFVDVFDDDGSSPASNITTTSF